MAGAAPGLAPAVAADCAGDEAPAGCGFWDRLSCFLHIEKFKASRSGTIANRIIIKRSKGIKRGHAKHKCILQSGEIDSAPANYVASRQP